MFKWSVALLTAAAGTPPSLCWLLAPTPRRRAAMSVFTLVNKYFYFFNTLIFPIPDCRLLVCKKNCHQKLFKNLKIMKRWYVNIFSFKKFKIFHKFSQVLKFLEKRFLNCCVFQFFLPIFYFLHMVCELIMFR